MITDDQHQSPPTCFLVPSVDQSNIHIHTRTRTKKSCLPRALIDVESLALCLSRSSRCKAEQCTYHQSAVDRHRSKLQAGQMTPPERVCVCTRSNCDTASSVATKPREVLAALLFLAGVVRSRFCATSAPPFPLPPPGNPGRSLMGILQHKTLGSTHVHLSGVLCDVQYYISHVHHAFVLFGYEKMLF